MRTAMSRDAKLIRIITSGQSDTIAQELMVAALTETVFGEVLEEAECTFQLWTEELSERILDVAEKTLHGEEAESAAHEVLALMRVGLRSGMCCSMCAMLTPLAAMAAIGDMKRLSVGVLRMVAMEVGKGLDWRGNLIEEAQKREKKLTLRHTSKTEEFEARKSLHVVWRQTREATAEAERRMNRGDSGIQSEEGASSREKRGLLETEAAGGGTNESMLSNLAALKSRWEEEQKNNLKHDDEAARELEDDMVEHIVGALKQKLMAEDLRDSVEQIKDSLHEQN